MILKSASIEYSPVSDLAHNLGDGYTTILKIIFHEACIYCSEDEISFLLDNKFKQKADSKCKMNMADI